MAWSHIRDWAVGSSTGGVPNATASDAAAGSTLVAVVTGRTGTSAFTVTDNLGGTWHAAPASGGGVSILSKVYVRLNAGGVNSVSVANTDAVITTVQVSEFAGGPTTGSPTFVSAGADNATSSTPASLTVAAPDDALVVGGIATGVTNRVFTLQGSAYAATTNEYKASSLNSLMAWDIIGAAATTGPSWNVTTGSSISSISVTAAITGGVTLTPPTVSAGADRTVETGTANFTITGTATPNGSGVTIVSRAWERISGPTVTLSATTTATVTVTPPSSTGTLVLRHSATDSSGQTATDDVNVTFVQPGQSLRPSTDVNNAGGWTATPGATPIASNIDEVTASAADFIASPSTPTGAAYTTGLGSGFDPGVDTGHVVEVMLWREAGITSHTMAVALMQGATVIATRDFTDLTTTPTVRQFELTEAEADDITDYSALRLRFTATAA